MQEAKATTASATSDTDDFPTLSSALEDMRDEFDFQRSDVKEVILSRMGEIDLTEILTKESVSIPVDIIPGNLSVEFRTLTATEDLTVKERLYRLTGSSRFVLDHYILYSLACGMDSFNGAKLIPHITYTKNGAELSEEALTRRFAGLKRLPLQTLALLSCVYGWFDARVRTAMIDGILGK